MSDLRANAASPEMQVYFHNLKQEMQRAFDLAQQARAVGYDPDTVVEVALAENLAERVIGLISVVAPQIKGTGVVERILELEGTYGKLDWRVAFVVALEVAQEKYCKFKDKIEAIEIGIRVGFAYVTVGVVSSPLEGFTKLELKKRNDGQGEYFSLFYSGPIRNAGGTAAAVSVLIADYIRKHLGYVAYDPTEKEIKRCAAELEDYHNWITNLQYFPSVEETTFLMERMPIEIDGDESEKYEVSNVNLKDLPRVKANKLRNGYSLIHSSCIPLKAPKLWAKLEKWGREFGMEEWDFLKEFVQLQKKMKAKGKKEESSKIVPDYTYIKDLVAGRPVFAHPMRAGGWRLRYGRSRASGYSGQAIHPASMAVLNDFLATGTQLKVERPGKAAAFTPCDTVDGPILLLKDGSVKRVTSEQQARKIRDQIKEILYLGDVLVNYGDFFDRAHSLVPPGYCQEFWIAELEKASMALGAMLDLGKLAAITDVERERLELMFKQPLTTQVSFSDALKIAHATKTPLHPTHTLFWRLLSVEQLLALAASISNGRRESEKLVLPYQRMDGKEDVCKTALETLGVEHLLVENEYLVLEHEAALQVLVPLGLGADNAALHELGSKLAPLVVPEDGKRQDVLLIVNAISPVVIRDKGGIFVGSRMGRPEKAKMRQMTGSPHCLFPIGDEGGRLRSFQAALQAGKVTSAFPICYCPKCRKQTPLFRCETCDTVTKRLKHCPTCGVVEDCPHNPLPSSVRSIDVRPIFEGCLAKLQTSIYPDLIKGVRGTSNNEHIPEHPIKGILRAKHNIHVNKDGTLRYDASEVTLSHFKPKEIGVPIARLRELGYRFDIHGEELSHDEQVLELKVQDVVLPCCPENPEEPADEVFFHTANFVDELLVKLYGLPAYYNLKSKQDLVGQLIIGLAPHTSAGSLGRIIGFSKTQGFLAHPYFHAAMRRDCFTTETYIPIAKDGAWRMQRIGDLVESLKPSKIVDAHGTLEAKPIGYSSLGFVGGKIGTVPLTSFTKHAPMPIIALSTSLGKRLRTTANHKHLIQREGKEMIVRAESLKIGDVLKLPYRFSIPSRDTKEINLLDELGRHDWLMVRGMKALVPTLRTELQKLGVAEKDMENFAHRDSVPAGLARRIMMAHRIDPKRVRVAAKRDSVELPAVISITDELLSCIGLYIAEGYARNQRGVKGSYQVYIAAERAEIRAYVRRVFKEIGLFPSEKKKDRVTYSSRIVYELFVNVLGAGSSAYEKRLPPRFLQLPPRRLGKLLSGYFEGDGSVSATDLRLVFDTVSVGLLHDMEFVLGRLGVFLKLRTSTRFPGRKLCEFYERKKRVVPKFTCTRGIVQSMFIHKLSRYVSFLSREKRTRHEAMLQKKFRNLFCKYDDDFFYDAILSVDRQASEPSYCLNVENHHVIANGILTRQCDGDESCFLLLMDAFLNFSRKFLSESRGSTMDAPLVLTSILTPSEVDDMAFHVDIAWKYPLELYLAALEYKKPWEVSVPQIKDVLGTPAQYEGMGFTHDTADINAGVRCSAYKLLPSMEEKIQGQMDLAIKIRACDASDVARLVIEKHFIRDTKGNLRKFSQQQYRCVACNEKFRRPPLRGNCTHCGGRIIFTISEGSVVKYLEPSISLAKKFNVPIYLQQDLELTKRAIESNFGRDAELQEGLGKWFG